MAKQPQRILLIIPSTADGRFRFQYYWLMKRAAQQVLQRERDWPD